MIKIEGISWETSLFFQMWSGNIMGRQVLFSNVVQFYKLYTSTFLSSAKRSVDYEKVAKRSVDYEKVEISPKK